MCRLSCCHDSRIHPWLYAGSFTHDGFHNPRGVLSARCTKMARTACRNHHFMESIIKLNILSIPAFRCNRRVVLLVFLRTRSFPYSSLVFGYYAGAVG